MPIILSTDYSCSIDRVQDWLAFNGINFDTRQLWNPVSHRYQLPTHLDHSVLVCNHMLLVDLLSSQCDHLIDFCKKQNRIWILGKDSALVLLTLDPVQQKNLLLLNDTISPNQILYVLDARLTDQCSISSLHNVKFFNLVNNFWFNAPRIQANTSNKVSPQHDFLLTMIRRKTRPHREILWQQMNLRPNVMRRGLVSCKPNHDNWVGRRPVTHEWFDGHASMDLYLDCCLEIVPETCYRDLYYSTEKTQKPLATKTPFLLVSTQGYLAHLRDLGFRTFSPLIDEGYDQQHRVEDRVSMMLDTLEDVMRNGAYSFYQASADILDHNFSRLCEITGGWQHQFDQLMWQLLEQSKAQSP